MTTEYFESSMLDGAMLPVSYSLVMRSDTFFQSMRADFGGDSVVVTVESPPDTFIRTLLLDGDSYLMDNNMIGHYSILAKRVNLSRTEPSEFFTFIPQIFGKAVLKAVPGADTEYMGQKAKKLNMEISGVPLNMIIDPVFKKAFAYGFAIFGL